MLDIGLSGLLYPKAITLFATVAVVLVWLLYYCYRLKQKNEVILGSYHAPYIAYSTCIIIWISSNAYFHTDLLPLLGSEGGIFMAKLANLASFFAFAFAFYFSCQLAAEQKKGKVKLWQQGIFVALTVYSLVINLRPNLTVENVLIDGPSQFVIEFGPHTSYFFMGLVTFVVMTLTNLISMRANSSKLSIAKNNYMIAGILVFMLSTAVIHLGMTYFLGDFSLTWLPPALSISEMLFVGYALLTSRFYSAKYLAYLTISVLFVCTIFVLPLGAVFIPMSEDNQWLISIPICALIGITWHLVYKRVSRIASFFIYGNRQTPVQQILALEEEFKRSIDDAVHQLSTLLNIPNDKLQLVTSNYTETFYEDYLHSNDSVLVLDELSERLDEKPSSKGSIKALYERMRSSNTALVMPLFGREKSVSHLLISSHKSDNKLFSNEEISALQTLLIRVQNTIESDRKIRQSRALANSIAHEMRNPLAQVQLQFEALKQHIDSNASDDKIRSDIEKGQAAIQRGRQLIDIILREVSDTSAVHEPLSLTSIHKAVDLAVSRYGFENEHIIERVKLPTQNDFVAKINETLFNFVIFNLIRNAIYYFDSYPNSQIEIRTLVALMKTRLFSAIQGLGLMTASYTKSLMTFSHSRKAAVAGLAWVTVSA